MAEIKDLLVEQFFRTTVAISAVLGQKFITVADSSGFPVPTGSEYFYLTIVVGDVAKVYTIVGNDTGSNTLEASGVLSETILVDSRAEHWFTAQAFEDIQTAIEGLGGTVVIPPDGTTILGGASLKVGLIDGTYLDLNNTILAGHLANESVKTAALGLLAVTNAKILSMDASKLTGALPTSTVTDAVERTVIGDPATAALDFLHIAYVEQDFDHGQPSIGPEGSIVIEFEEPIP